jgi:hypothetical protein
LYGSAILQDYFDNHQEKVTRYMRTRTKSVPFVAGDHYQVNTHFHYTNSTFPDSTSEEMIDTSGLTYPEKVGTITDLESVDLGVFVDPVTGRWRRRKTMKPKISFEIPNQPGLLKSEIRPSKPCHHVMRKLEFQKNIQVSHQRVNSAGNLIFERTDTRTQVFDDALQLMYSLGLDPVEILDGSHDTGGAYLNHDWFALADNFREACDQFLPSSFLVGESIVENSIFIDAFKAVINPSRALKYLLHAGLSLGPKSRRLTLGHVSHQIAKKSANAHLTYAFGIRPAISDLLDTFDAHKKVSSRLKYLRSSQGRYVPVRVKKELFSSSDSQPTGNSNPLTAQSLEWATTWKSSTARIGCWGRVRDDLTYTSDWSAYLQYFGINKVVGLAWELIPFSFVVDWFTNAQERINSLTRLRIGGPFAEFVHIYSSVKKVSHQELFLIHGRDTAFQGGSVEHGSVKSILSLEEIDYLRLTSIPDTSGVLDFSALGLFHAITTAGLIIQRW